MWDAALHIDRRNEKPALFARVLSSGSFRPMAATAPHYYLIPAAQRTPSGGKWRFDLLSKAGRPTLSAEDFEPGERSAARLELTALARGLEALDGPARVTVLVNDQHIRQGLSFGLAEWKANAWQWEHYEQWAPVKNADLWRRVDRAMDFHDVRCAPRSTGRGDQPRSIAGQRGPTHSPQPVSSTAPASRAGFKPVSARPSPTSSANYLLPAPSGYSSVSQASKSFAQRPPWFTLILWIPDCVGQFTLYLLDAVFCRFFGSEKGARPIPIPAGSPRVSRC